MFGSHAGCLAGLTVRALPTGTRLLDGTCAATMCLSQPRASNACIAIYTISSIRSKADAELKFGIKVTLPAGDTFSSLLGDGWERLHWFATEEERDRAYEKMSIRHGYYRNTDSPTQVLVKLVR